MINQKSPEKTNTLLIVFVVVLAVILSAEMYYLFIYKKQQSMDNTTKTVEDALLTKTPPITNLYKKIPNDQVDFVYENITSKIDSTRVGYKNGTLSELILTEVYKSVVINIGNTEITRVLPNKKEQKFDFIFQFATMAEEGKKEMGLLFTKDELKKVKVHDLRGDETVEIAISEIKAGDFVRVIIETNLIESPSKSMVSMTIQKLP